MKWGIVNTRSDWTIPSALIALSLVPVLAGIVRLTELAGDAKISAENARFFASPIPVTLHIATVIVYSIVGAFQFSPGFRRRKRGWHRTAGWILIPTGVMVALSGLWMTQFYAWPPGDGQIVYFERLFVGTAMLGSLALAVHSIRHRDFASHGAWMTRAYALALGAGTQVFTHIPWFVLVGDAPGGMARALMMGGGWAINIIAAEWIIRRRHPRPRGILATAP